MKNKKFEEHHFVIINNLKSSCLNYQYTKQDKN